MASTIMQYFGLLMATTTLFGLQADALGQLVLPLTYQTEDYLYYATLGVGTPAEQFRLAVDTGSANIWVTSSSCNSAVCSQRAQYNPRNSRTSKVLGTVVPIQYGRGSITSILVNDMFTVLPCLAGKAGNSRNISCPIAGDSFKQTFGMAVSMQGLQGSPWDGVLGMGRSSLAAAAVQVPLLSMYQQGLVSSPEFGLYLLRNASAANAGGELTLGGWNANRVQGEPTWIDVITPESPTLEGFWSVPVQQLQLEWPNGRSSIPNGACGSSNSGGGSSSSSVQSCVGLLDSGTAQLVGSLDQVTAVNAALGGAPSIKQLPFSCNDLVAQVLSATVEALASSTPKASANAVCSNLFGSDESSLALMMCNVAQQQLAALSLEPPSETILNQAQQQSVALCEQLPYAVNVTLECSQVGSLPNISFTLGGASFSLQAADYAYQNPTDLLCYSGLSVISSLPAGTWLLGDAFMHNYYTVFDYGLPGSQQAGVTSGFAAGSAAAGAGARASGGGNGNSQPRVGIGLLNAAEQAAAAALFDQAIASKSSGSGQQLAPGVGAAGVLRWWLCCLLSCWLVQHL